MKLIIPIVISKGNFFTMAEFLNYKVNLTLKDGTHSTGIISRVDGNLISLNNVLQSINSNKSNNGNNSKSNIETQLSELNISSSEISDLKVIQLPPDLMKTPNLNNNGNNNNNSNNKSKKKDQKSNDVSLLDDAILFAKPANPNHENISNISNSNFDSSDERSNSYSTNSRSNTPRIKSTKISKTSNNSIDLDKDVQDIKGSNEFDFASNLALFDKKSVFADFQKNDHVGLQDRLVGHNKSDKIKAPNSTPQSQTQAQSKSKPKKEKYDNNEMVLDVNKSDNWDLIGNLNKRLGNSNGSSRNNSSSNLLKNDQSNSNVPANKNFKLVNSNNPKSTIPLSSPVQLLEIERIASELYGVHPSIMTEVCATNLSSLITTNILGGSTRLSNKNNHNLPPLVLLLIGSERCGSRAFATGRHLTNHGVRVLAYVINNGESNEELSNQWEIFENCGGKVIVSSVNDLLNILNNELDTPVELIVDALQGYDDHLEDIFYQEDDLKSVQSLIEWANEPKQRNKVLSLDIPSGIDGGSGTILDSSLKLNCKWIISMGLPITGLIHAYKNGHLNNNEDEIIHHLIDIGIPNKVYCSKSNLRKFDKFWFSSEFSLKLDISNE